MSIIHIGTITQAHGIKGLVKVIAHIDDDTLFNGDVQTGDDETLTIAFKNRLGKYLLAAIEGVEDRNASEALKGTKLYLPADTLPEDDAYRVIGMDVVENSTSIGTVTDIENYGAGDLFVVTLTTGQSILIPDHDNFVVSVDETLNVKNHGDLIF